MGHSAKGTYLAEAINRLDLILLAANKTANSLEFLESVSLRCPAMMFVWIRFDHL